MSNKILPLEKNTWIQAYHIRNFELGILQSKTPWIYEKYINCYYKPSGALFNHCMPEQRYFVKNGVMLVQKFRFNKSIYKFEIFDFLKWAKDLLSSGWYILGYFDEYYIPEKSSYKHRHYRHSMLIYGYDEEHELFYAMGYTRSRKYISHCLTFDEFISSIGGDFDRENEDYVKGGIEKIELDAFKLNSVYDFSFDLRRVYASLLDYVNSEDSGYRRQRGQKYGFDCEIEFVNYIIGNKGFDLDERYSRFFMELKELMVRRLEYLTIEKIVSQEILSKYKEICEYQKIIHLLFIKYNLIRDENIIDRIVVRMKKIIEAEKEIVPRIVDQIHDHLVQRHDEEYL